MKKLKVLDLFSGIGGFSLGLERTGGFETVAFCEIEPFCQKVLKKHWPDIEVFNDITRFKYRKNVDLVTSGFPCQDISLAGKGAGLSGDRSGLFWYIIRTLCMVGRPKALLENVAALLNRGLSTVLGALASFGYDTEWHCLQASYVGARHIRDRVWIYTYPNSTGLQKRIDEIENTGEAGLGVKQGCTSYGISQQKKIYSNPNGWREPLWGAIRRMGQKELLSWDGGWTIPIESAVCRKNNGIPNRLDRLRGCGNAVVPQIPEIIGRAILEVEEII